MRTKFFTFLALSSVTILTVISTGCSKSNNNPGGGSISGTFGGTNFSSGTSLAWYSQDSAIYEFQGWSFASHDTTILSFYIQPPFTLNQPITDFYAASMDIAHTHTGADYSNYGGPGHIALTVTSLDTTNHKIAGSYTGVLYNYFNSNDSIAVTNGKFSTSYFVQP